MPRPDLLSVFLSRFHQLGVPYMVTGAVAAIVYGEPRLTHDIDIVLEIGPDRIEDIPNAFPSDAFYTPPLETLRTETQRPLRGHFNIIHHETGFRADVYAKGDDPLHDWALSRRRLVEVHGTAYAFAPPEYVILRKLQYHAEGASDKHIRDIRAMLDLSADRIDRDVIQRKAEALGLSEEWEALLNDQTPSGGP